MAADIHAHVLLAAFAVASIAGATMARTHFCTMGAVSDWVLMGHLDRLRSWMLAMAVAVAGLLVLELSAIARLPADTFPPYRTPQLAWVRNLVGGLLFGVGMSLGGGCGTKTLVRIGGGSGRALFVAAVIAAVAYAMLATDLFAVLVLSWTNATVIDLASRGFAGQHLDALASGALGLPAEATRAVLGLCVVAALLADAEQDGCRLFDGALGHVDDWPERVRREDVAGVLELADDVVAAGVVGVVGHIERAQTRAADADERPRVDGEPKDLRLIDVLDLAGQGQTEDDGDVRDLEPALREIGRERSLRGPRETDEDDICEVETLGGLSVVMLDGELDGLDPLEIGLVQLTEAWAACGLRLEEVRVAPHQVADEVDRLQVVDARLGLEEASLLGVHDGVDDEGLLDGGLAEGLLDGLVLPQ